jgi:large subunit ribosomal protein L25
MIQNIVVQVEERKSGGSNAAGRIRREGKVPGIVYGLGLDPFPVAVESRRVEEILHLETGRNTIFTLQLAGQDRSRAVMIRALQRDPVTDRMIHVDFVRVDLARKIRVQVPIRAVGVAEGVKNEGGLLEYVHRTVEVECLPGSIPEALEVDVTALHLNQNVSVADLKLAEGVDVLDDPETILVVVTAPREEEAAPVEAAAATTAEPEVIKKGKEAAEEGEKKGEKK